MRRTTAASNAGTLAAYALVEYVVRSPAVSLRSFIEVGTPWNGASETARLRRARRSEGTLGVDGHVCIELRIEPFDPLEIELGELDRRHLMCTHARREAPARA